MSEETLKIVIPMAGYGTRLRPHTWSKPKPLVSAAGKTVLAHVMDMFRTLPDPDNVELIFIVGYLGEQVEPYMQEHFPNVKTHYVEQVVRKGQSHAIYLAKELLSGPMIMAFVDTLIEADLSGIKDDPDTALVWVKAVDDPRRFGVAEQKEDGTISRLIEKPDSVENNLAMVGFYYFPEAKDLVSAIEYQIEEDIQLKGEYFLADAVNVMLERGMRMKPAEVDVWLDAGLPETVLATNKYLLENGRSNQPQFSAADAVEIIEPVFIHPTAEISSSRIGPHVSVGAGCKVTKSFIEDSVLEPGAVVHDSILTYSIVGARAKVNDADSQLNIGDDSTVGPPIE